MSSEVRTPWKIYRWPIVVGILTFTGLVSALLGDGIWDGLSWAVLTAPLIAIVWRLWGRN